MGSKKQNALDIRVIGGGAAAIVRRRSGKHKMSVEGGFPNPQVFRGADASRGLKRILPAPSAVELVINSDLLREALEGASGPVVLAIYPTSVDGAALHALSIRASLQTAIIYPMKHQPFDPIWSGIDLDADEAGP